MKVYEATVIDKCASPSGEEPVSFESYVAVNNDSFRKLPEGWNDEQIHYYFSEQLWNELLHNGEIETEEFKYLIGERVA